MQIIAIVVSHPIDYTPNDPLEWFKDLQNCNDILFALEQLQMLSLMCPEPDSSYRKNVSRLFQMVAVRSDL